MRGAKTRLTDRYIVCNQYIRDQPLAQAATIDGGILALKVAGKNNPLVNLELIDTEDDRVRCMGWGGKAWWAVKQKNSERLVCGDPA